MNAKLTLSVDPRVVAAAKRYAAETGTSVSQLVEDYLAAIAGPPAAITGASAAATPATPILARLRGSLRGVNVEDHRRHLAEKYGCAESSST